MDRKLTPDIEQARRHLRALDKNSTVFTFQVFDDDVQRKDPSLAKTLRGTLDGLAKTLGEYQRKGAGVFVTVNETKGPRRKKGDVTAYRAIWREADEPGLLRLPLEPHLVVESSPGHAHEYLIIEPSTALDKGDRIMQTMVDKHGSCPGAKDRARVLRLAGFYHLKNPTAPHLVNIIRERTTPPYTLAQVAEVISPAEAPARPKAAPAPVRRFDGSTGTPYGIKALEGECAEVASAPQGTRNDRLNKAAHTLARLCAGGELNAHHARRELTHAAQAAGLNENEIPPTIESGWRTGLEKPRKAPEKKPFGRTPQARGQRGIKAASKDCPATIIPPGHPTPHTAWVVVGSASNAILVAQAAGDLVGAIALGSCSAKPDEAAAVLLTRAAFILVALDADDAGAKSWSWWREHYPQAERWPVPEGKDPGDYRKAGGDIRAWVLAGLPPGLRPAPAPACHSEHSEGSALSSPFSKGGQRGIEEAQPETPSPSMGEGRGEGATPEAPDLIPVRSRCPECRQVFETYGAPDSAPYRGPCYECLMSPAKPRKERYLDRQNPGRA
ncbi:MAG: hypothetical protein ACE5GY_07120 [Thermodesulfobacteriota bacterium]